jgi:transcription elongation GreA/GreB family factor
MRKGLDDEISVELPGGSRKLLIVEIRYGEAAA